MKKLTIEEVVIDKVEEELLNGEAGVASPPIQDSTNENTMQSSQRIHDTGAKDDGDAKAASPDVAREDDLEEDDDFNFSDFEASTSTSTSRRSKIPGVISIVNNSNGNRVSLSRPLMKQLDNPDSVQFAFKDNEFIIAKSIPNIENRLSISKAGKRNIIYARELVVEITSKYGLDFSNRTSLTLYKVKYKRVLGQVIAFIQMG